MPRPILVLPDTLLRKAVTPVGGTTPAGYTKKRGKKPGTYIYVKARVRLTEAEVEKRRLERTLRKMQRMIGQGKIKGTLAQHVAIAKVEIHLAERAFKPLTAALRRAAPKDALVTGRIKALESALGKIVRQPEKYGDVSDLYDVTGTRVQVGTVREVRRAVEDIRRSPGIKILSEWNYLDEPRGDYRSYHLTIEHEGQQKEVQVRTFNMDVIGEWAHFIYKPMNKKQEQWLERYSEPILAYQHQAWEHYWSADNGVRPPEPSMPNCHPVVKRTFGCIPPAKLDWL